MTKTKKGKLRNTTIRIELNQLSNILGRKKTKMVWPFSNNSREKESKINSGSKVREKEEEVDLELSGKNT